MRRSQGMIAEILTKECKMMRLKNSTQFNQHEYSKWSSDMLLSPFCNALHGADIIESRLEGP